MIEKGEILTLDDDNEYAVTAVTIIDNIEYLFLMDTNDYSNFMFCSVNNDEVEEIDDLDLIQTLAKEFDVQLNNKE